MRVAILNGGRSIPDVNRDQLSVNRGARLDRVYVIGTGVFFTAGTQGTQGFRRGISNLSMTFGV